MPKVVAGLALVAMATLAFLGPPGTTKDQEVTPEDLSALIREAATSTGTGYKRTLATMFWVGEASGPENDYIPNHVSYWDGAWLAHFGGVDDPECRRGYYPCGFTPKENPFYVALPYGERTTIDDATDELRESAESVPWFDEAVLAGAPLLKNRWVEVNAGGKSCYGQWEDVGPFEDNDYEFVFGDSPIARNIYGVAAGIDLSPALFTCLGFDSNMEVEWRFVPADKVPAGPWTAITTKSGVNFTEAE